jgi:hypothetical protein
MKLVLSLYALFSLLTAYAGPNTPVNIMGKSYTANKMCEVDGTYCYKLFEDSKKTRVKKPKKSLLMVATLYKDEIKKLAKRYKVPATAIAGAFIAENTMNVQNDDDVQDLLMTSNVFKDPTKYAGDFSSGLGQLNITPALEAEEKVVYKIEGRRKPYSREKVQELIKKPKESLKYMTGIMRLAINVYKKHGIDISKDVGVLTTIYNIGKIEQRVKRTVEEKRKPGPNYFGFFVAYHMSTISEVINKDVFGVVKGNVKIGKGLNRDLELYASSRAARSDDQRDYLKRDASERVTIIQKNSKHYTTLIEDDKNNIGWVSSSILTTSSKGISILPEGYACLRTYCPDLQAKELRTQFIKHDKDAQLYHYGFKDVNQDGFVSYKNQCVYQQSTKQKLGAYASALIMGKNSNQATYNDLLVRDLSKTKISEVINSVTTACRLRSDWAVHKHATALEKLIFDFKKESKDRDFLVSKSFKQKIDGLINHCYANMFHPCSDVVEKRENALKDLCTDDGCYDVTPGSGKVCGVQAIYLDKAFANRIQSIRSKSVDERCTFDLAGNISLMKQAGDSPCVSAVFVPSEKLTLILNAISKKKKYIHLNLGYTDRFLVRVKKKCGGVKR